MEEDIINHLDAKSDFQLDQMQNCTWPIVEGEAYWMVFSKIIQGISFPFEGLLILNSSTTTTGYNTQLFGTATPVEAGGRIGLGCSTKLNGAYF